MSTSSGFGLSSSVATRGSRAMPQIGHAPGASRTISGCIGQVYSIASLASGGRGAGSGEVSRSPLAARRSPASNFALHDGLQK
jgi:hypothetical protein